MKKRREEHEEHVNHERWLITYADLITLLMVFFVVMYSMSSINEKKFSAIAEQLGVSLGGGPKKAVISGSAGTTLHSSESKDPGNPLGESGSHSSDNGGKSAATPTPTPNKGNVQSHTTPDPNMYAGLNPIDEAQLQQVEKSIKEFIIKENLSGEVFVDKDIRGTVISFREALLFNKGSADIQNKSIPTLSKIASIISQTENYIHVEGFTDDLPIHTTKFASNWELAAQRSINVAKLLIGQGLNPGRISCLSYGEYRPSVPNDGEENRSKNRRVDIILVYKTLGQAEPGMKAE